MSAKKSAVLPGAEHGVLFKNGTVLTMDKQKTILKRGDVLVRNDKIVAIGTDLTAPDGVLVIDAEGE